MPQPHPSANLGDSGVDPGAPARDSARGARDERLAAGVPCSARAEEERDLDASVGAQPRELADLGVGQHHHAAALRDPPDRHCSPVRLVEHRFEDPRALDRRDLDAVPEAVGEPSVAHRAKLTPAEPAFPVPARACGRPRPSASASNQITPRTLEGIGVARQREHLSHAGALDAEEEHLVELEHPAVAFAAGPIERCGAVVAREHVDQLRPVGAVRLLRERREESEDRVAARGTCPP